MSVGFACLYYVELTDVNSTELSISHRIFGEKGNVT